MLYLVATPIGNLEDISLRALRVLKEVDLILAEDTRKTKLLLAQYDIKTTLLSFHDHNEKSMTPRVRRWLEEGKSIAVVSNAGTPVISDPGYSLVKECIAAKLPFTSIPGPCAVANALVLSGLAPDKFFFAGFLSPKKGKRSRQLEALSHIPATLIIYESPHRIKTTLELSLPFFQDKQCVLLREMTKKFEQIISGYTVGQLVGTLESITLKGEFVITIDNRI